MNKKLLAAAVAGALAIPGVALADGSGVTISGFFKVGVENINIGSGTTDPTLGLKAPDRANSSENRLIDNSSRIIFNVSEDLGGGLSAIGQYDLRVNPHVSGASATTNMVSTGNNWVGLKSTQWGQVTLGNGDLHYFHTADTIPGGATALDAWSVGVLGFVPTFNGTGGATGALAIANDTRTPNVIQYSSPTWGMFNFTAAYSTDSYDSVGSMTTVPAGGCASAPNPLECTTQKADAWNFAPQLTGSNWQAGFSYWKSQAPGGSTASTATSTVYTTAPDQKSDRLWGFYEFQGFRVGLTWDRSEYDTHGGAVTSSPDIKRSAWSLPLSYSWGPSSVGWTHTVAQNVSISGLPAGSNPSTSNTGAKLDAIYYQYSLSKQTQMAVTYANLKNDSNAAYNLFTSAALGTADAGVAAGEDPRTIQFTINHSF